jgi:hypothetical protein
MSKKLFSFTLLTVFLIGIGCSNVGKPGKKHHKGPSIKASGKMNRYK